MKNTKRMGITMLVLLVTIVVTLIIVSTVLIGYENIVGNTKKSEFAKEMYLVKKMVIDYEFMNSSYPVSDEISVDLNNINADYQEQFSEEPGYSTNSIKLNKIDLYKAGVENVVRGTTKYGEDDVYAFSTSTKKVYYLKGENISHNIYYTLTDELYKLIDIYDVK